MSLNYSGHLFLRKQCLFNKLKTRLGTKNTFYNQIAEFSLFLVFIFSYLNTSYRKPLKPGLKEAVLTTGFFWSPYNLKAQYASSFQQFPTPMYLVRRTLGTCTYKQHEKTSKKFNLISYRAPHEN